MTKQEIVDIVSNATGLTKVETETIMNGVMSTIIDSLANNEKVELRGFGTFGNDPRKEYALEPYRQFGEPRIVGLTLSYSLSGENQ